MSGNQQMPQADIAKEFSQFSDAQKHYFKKITKSNEKRGKAIGILRGQNRRFATLLGVGVLGICILASGSAIFNNNMFNNVSNKLKGS